MIEHLAIVLALASIPLILYKTAEATNTFFEKKETPASVVILSAVYLIFLTFLYIFFFVFDIHSIKQSYFKGGDEIIVFFLSTINILVYLVFPLVYFIIQVQEEKSKSKK
jgi:hypothetical protein